MGLKILALDSNHPVLIEKLIREGYQIDEDYSSPYSEIIKKIKDYDGIIIRSRIPIDKNLLEAGKSLKFIARVGAGLENINTDFADSKGIKVINSPEGNKDSLGEHTIGMLLLLLHRLKIASEEVKDNIWKREENRGDELMGKTVGLIGYGNMGKAFAQRLKGFGVKTIFYDIADGLSDENATQVTLEQLKQESDIISLHVPATPETYHMINEAFIRDMKKPFYLINTARGQCIDTMALIKGLETGKIKGAALDVLEFEHSSFEEINLEANNEFNYLKNHSQVLLTPHIAGWSHQSKYKLADIIADKIINEYSAGN